MKTQEVEKRYRISELHKKYGYPIERLREVARKVNRKSDPNADTGFYYSLTASEVRKYLG